MKEFLHKPIIKFLISILSVFAPIKHALLTTFVLVLMDMITGSSNAKRKKQFVSYSNASRRTLEKLLKYVSLMILAFLTQTYLTGDSFPLVLIVNNWVGFTEFLSIAENLGSKDSMFRSLLNKLKTSRGK